MLLESRVSAFTTPTVELAAGAVVEVDAVAEFAGSSSNHLVYPMRSASDRFSIVAVASTNSLPFSVTSSTNVMRKVQRGMRVFSAIARQ